MRASLTDRSRLGKPFWVYRIVCFSMSRSRPLPLLSAIVGAHAPFVATARVRHDVGRRFAVRRGDGAPEGRGHRALSMISRRAAREVRAAPDRRAPAGAGVDVDGMAVGARVALRLRGHLIAGAHRTGEAGAAAATVARAARPARRAPDLTRRAAPARTAATAARQDTRDEESRKTQPPGNAHRPEEEHGPCHAQRPDLR
jgi:hypothetical protein